MPFPPIVPRDPFDALGRAAEAGANLLDAAAGGINRLTGSGSSGFEANVAPSASGLGTRQSRIRNNRPAVAKRNLIRWMVPEQPVVQMYLNPQNMKIDHKKNISKVRTKGGFVLQYWGEDLIAINISGTTGSSGIEGINVLYDLYRNEQLMFDPYALFIQAQQDQQKETSLLQELTGVGDNFIGQIGNILNNARNGGVPDVSRTKPSLASLAFTVELYWSGEVYRGFFENFSVTERADNIGMFDYNITYTATQKRGFRQNFFGWHRSATDGPSNSNPVTGVPYSLSGSAPPIVTPRRNNVDQPSLSSTFASFAQSSFNAIGGLAEATTGGIIDAFDVF